MTRFQKYQLILVVLLIGISAFYGGYYFGERGYLFELRKNPPEIKVTNRYPEDQEIDFGLFWQVWDTLKNNYLLRPVDGQKMLYGAIKGMVSSLGDPYTSYLLPSLNETANNSLNGLYQGIGAELGLRDGQLVVVAPLHGSPAAAAGVRSGDAIVEIEGESTIGFTLTEAVAKIRGDAGTVSTLTLQRDSGTPFVVKITRDTIRLESVTWEDKGDGIAYIRIGRFGGETNDDWANVVSEINLDMTELDAIIVDLRGNPGGYLRSAVYIAEEFYTDAPVLFQEDAVGEQVESRANRIGSFQQVPAVYVLIDRGSASSSEILAAALRSNINATLIGEKSFGKGTIQNASDFEDGSGLHITIAKWLTPEKEWVHDVGVTPDIEVQRTNEDYENNVDPQLDVAIDLAKQF